MQKLKQKHRNNRAIQLNRNGFKPSIRRQRYKIQPFDIVWVNGKKETVSGCHNLGKSVMLTSKKDIGIKNIQKIYNFGSLAWAI